MPRELLATAEAVLTNPSPSMRHCWRRPGATLIRIALEQALNEHWQRRGLQVTTRSMRSQLLILPIVAGVEVTALARGTWNALCRAIHHHTYELPPTASELRGWHRDVAALMDLLEPETGGATVAGRT